MFASMPVMIPVLSLLLLSPLYLKYRLGGAMTPVELRSWLTARASTAVAVSLFLVHAPIAGQAFLLFSCKDIGGSRAYLIADMGQLCYDALHTKWALGLGLPIIGAPSLPVSCCPPRTRAVGRWGGAWVRGCAFSRVLSLMSLCCLLLRCWQCCGWSESRLAPCLCFGTSDAGGATPTSTGGRWT